MGPVIPLQQLALAALTGLAVVVGGFLMRTFWRRRKYKLPITVPGVPIVGNTFQIPALQQGPWAKRLAEQYGEM